MNDKLIDKLVKVLNDNFDQYELDELFAIGSGQDFLLNILDKTARVKCANEIEEWDKQHRELMRKD